MLGWLVTSIARRSGDVEDLRRLYDEQGYVGPFTAFDRRDRARLDVLSFIQTRQEGLEWPRNRHLDVPAVARLCQTEHVISRVRTILGPDLLLWRSNIFAVSTNDEGFVWHQDEYRTLLDCRAGAEQCSVQLNLTDSTQFNCVAVVPGSHRWEPEDFERRGYRMVPGSDAPSYGGRMWSAPEVMDLVDVPMKAGQYYIFHPRLVHGSGAARAAARQGAQQADPPWWRRTASAFVNRRESLRCSIALRIVTPDAKVLPAAFVESPTRAACVLLSGTDRAGINPLGTWAA
jgi:ectoine hydroxylase-related dioxygenase (phytanoyl-CoA dioxygenase family)